MVSKNQMPFFRANFFSLFSGICILLSPIVLSAQDTALRIYYTKKISDPPPLIDGIFNDNVWNIVDWSENFIQREPFEGIDPTQKTYFKIVYDDDNVYVAIKVLDSEPGKIEKRLTRRDEFEGDWVGIAFDSYYDRLTAFSFAVNAAGVKNDLIVTNDDQQDDTWDPVWYVKTSIDELGWYAEMKIPLTQMRFAKNESLVWGMQVMRWLFRQEEFSTWQYIPQESSRWVSRYGELHGISGIKPKREIELIPYVMGNTERYLKEEDNPFATGEEYGYSAGLDGKIAVTNDLTMNFTINPDFGQVEADPSEVNLTAFETFFEEKRPFFIEGSNIYDFQVTDGDSDLSLDNLFYSRRIGRRPHYEPELNDDEYIDAPESTRILGAFKLSGKTRNGWSVGVMESVTNKEQATIDKNGERSKIAIEPYTNYFNTRLQKDFGKGKTVVGGMITSTNRFIRDDSLNFLPHSAYTGGLDFTNYWKDKSYFGGVNTVFSHITGSEESILELQQAPQRYYQRPDAKHLSIDSTRTTLVGNGGTIQGGKIGGGHWRYTGWVTWRTPGTELNDMGYLRQADIIQQVFWAQYRIWEPFSIFRNIYLNFNEYSAWDFAGSRIYLGSNVNFNGQFKNYWYFSGGIDRTATTLNRSELRGGPGLKYPGDFNQWAFISTDQRRKLVFEISNFNNWGGDNSSRFYNIGVELSYRPVNLLSVSLEPTYTNGSREMQYVETIDWNDDARYIISQLDSETLSTDIKIDLSITPDFSIQFWGQPFLFAGNYSNFKRVTDPLAENYEDRFYIFSGSEIVYDSGEDIYRVDENLDGSSDYQFDNPNFNFFEFRSNLVARWEYIPGSTIYLVWSQGRTGDNPIGEFNFRENITDLYSIVPYNIFLIKFSYRFSL
ncbi:MAG: carbohydrate binding family 9 domain-containing protein [Bacteroidales bacterium]|nr:carbohydrate binding family 9 domain-containing protein [Bacteroidales bacterium]